MLILGCHLSVSKGYAAMGRDAVKIGANTFQFFTRNPRGGNARAMDLQDANALSDIMKEHKMPVFVAHAPYTLNACAANEATREFAYRAMTEDLARLEFFPGNFYNFHPGSHVGQGEQAGIQLIAQLLNEALTPQQTTTVLLETMAGKGSEVGRTFGEIREILDRVQLQEKMGVCMDLCHVHDAGYDIVNQLDDTLEEFERIIGLDRLRAIHINDSKNPLGSHKDRHETIGNGHIGLDAMERIINHPQLRHLPFVLETPNDLDGYAREIQLLRSLEKDA